MAVYVADRGGLLPLPTSDGLQFLVASGTEFQPLVEWDGPEYGIDSTGERHEPEVGVSWLVCFIGA